jgi:uncharacterized protein (TIGR02117 family)
VRRAASRWLQAALLGPLLFAIGACATAPAGPLPRHDGPTVAIWLVTQAAHTGIAVRRADVPAGLWPESRDFPQADYLEVGWGERNYYMAHDPGLWAALRAALGSNPSVVHVAGIRGPLPGSFPASEIVELPLTTAGFDRLIRYIHDAYDRSGAPVVAPLGPGLYGDSRFYPGRETFNLLRTCNVWTAQGLHGAGLPVGDAITLEGLMSQVRTMGKLIQKPAG